MIRLKYGFLFELVRNNTYDEIRTFSCIDLLLNFAKTKVGITMSDLSPKMTETEFDNGYWYANELRAFAKDLQIPSAFKLRKDELEKAIKYFLRTGKVKNLIKRSLKKVGEKDIDKGLSLSLKIVHYTNNKQTKEFIVAEAKKIVPNLREKPGVRYRLNRWREEQITSGKKISYGDLVRKYIELSQSEKPFSRIGSCQ